jgi:2-methylcitrate dehydratase PrpD
MPDARQTDRLARFIEEFTFSQIPAPVVARTKEVIYDGLGALLAATSKRYDIGAVVTRFVRESGGTPDSGIFGTDLRTNCITAALVNGTLGYYCDIESHHPGAIMHAIAIVGPAALAAGERMHSSGREVLASIVLGVDVACRVSSALNPATLYARGFHPSCVAGTFGAMAAAAKVFGLRGHALRHAFGLAGTEASGLLAWASDPTEHSRPFNMGLASRHGVFAAHLASCGFGGPPAIFEGKYPLGHAFTGEWHEGELFRDLGERFKVMELYFKQYACCAFIHPGLDGLLDIRNVGRVGPDEIRSIVLRFPASGYRIIDGNPLRSHCAQYVLALAAYRGAIDFYDILHDQRSDERIASLSRRVQVIADDVLDQTYPELYRSIIEVETAGGARHVRDVVHPRGSPQNPLTRTDLTEKFSRLTADVLPPRRAAQIGDAVATMEELTDIQQLTKLLERDTSGAILEDADAHRHSGR